MNDFDWIQWSVLSSMAMAASGGGAWAGFRGGKAGNNLWKTLGAAASRGAFCVFALSLVAAVVIAHYELRELGRPIKHGLSSYRIAGMDDDCLRYITWADERGMSGLVLDQEGWLAAHYDGHGTRTYCDTCQYRMYQNPTGLMHRAMAKGLVWGVLTPISCALGMIPAMMAATMAFNFGARKRTETEFWTNQAGPRLPK